MAQTIVRALRSSDWRFATMAMNSAADPGSSARAKTGPKGAIQAVATGLAGAALSGALVGAILMSGGQARPSPAPGVMQISIVDPADLTGAASTLDASSAAALVAEAKACHAPLAVVTLSRAAGAGPGIVRIRSGSYLSPPFSVNETAQRIAIPFPDAYAVGHGTLSVEGAATGVQLTLYPTWSQPSLSGKNVINVTWRPDNPCGT
jgi:hypothetical protein